MSMRVLLHLSAETTHVAPLAVRYQYRLERRTREASFRVTTNTLLSFDIATTPDLPVVRATPAPTVRNKRMSWRSLLGGCLLNLPRVAWMLLDIALVCTGTILGDKLFVWWAESGNLLADYNLWLANLVLGSSIVLAGSIFGLYETTTLWSRSRIVARCLLAVTLAMLLTWVVLHLFMYSSLSRRAAASGVIFSFTTACSLRLLAHYAVRDVKRGLLVIGQGPLTGAIIRSVRRGSVPGYRLVGVVTSKKHGTNELGVSDIPVVGEIGNLEALVRQFNAAEVVVAENATKEPAYLRAALACLRLGCRVTDETTFYESTYGEVPVSHITPKWFLAADLKAHRQEHAVIKRVFDIVVAGMAIIISAPLLPIIACLIRLQGREPVFYSQIRVGQSGHHFRLYKFRTMYANAESSGSGNGTGQGVERPRWAVPNDPRVTPVGRILRKTRLDELPQLWNILRGDMAVVGPRPERPEFVGPLAALLPFYDERHLIKPGLTGWAQINYPYAASVADARRKLQLDLYYIKHTSIELDLVILLRTLGTFFLGSR